MAGARVHKNRGIRRSQGSRSIITELVVEKEPHASDRPTDAEHDWRTSGALKSFKKRAFYSCRDRTVTKTTSVNQGNICHCPKEKKVICSKPNARQIKCANNDALPSKVFNFGLVKKMTSTGSE